MITRSADRLHCRPAVVIIVMATALFIVFSGCRSQQGTLSFTGPITVRIYAPDATHPNCEVDCEVVNVRKGAKDVVRWLSVQGNFTVHVNDDIFANGQTYTVPNGAPGTPADTGPVKDNVSIDTSHKYTIFDNDTKKQCNDPGIYIKS